MNNRFHDLTPPEIAMVTQEDSHTAAKWPDYLGS
jgi:hypothetical protein